MLPVMSVSVHDPQPHGPVGGDCTAVLEEKQAGCGCSEYLPAFLPAGSACPGPRPTLVLL